MPTFVCRLLKARAFHTAIPSSGHETKGVMAIPFPRPLHLFFSPAHLSSKANHSAALWGGAGHEVTAVCLHSCVTYA